MKNVSTFKCILVLLYLSLFPKLLLAQDSKEMMGDPPENFYVTPTGLATWDAVSKSSQEFFFYKIFLDGVWKADVDTIFYPFGINEELIPGESYVAEIAALYSEGMSEKASFEFTYLPCDSFPGYNILHADFQEGGNQALLSWSDMAVPELIILNQAYGAPSNGAYQNYNYGYGVAYDFSSYPDAVIHALDFHHASWGVIGTWDYNIHIVDWDSKTLISSIGPFQTTVNDAWELGVFLGDVSTDGANTVAILMEPLSHDPNDAYPCISGDNDPEPEGSVFVDMEDLNSYTPSTIGKILMNAHIYTMNGGKYLNNSNPIGSHIYLDDQLIAFVPLPDTSYLIEGLSLPGFYDFCVSKVYSADDGLHSWESCPDELCILDAGLPEDCFAPENLTAFETQGNIVILCWDTPNGFDPIWLQYDDGVNVDGIGGPSEFQYAVKWDPDQLDGFDGAVISKIKFFPKESESSFSLNIWKGENASTLVYEQDLLNIEYDSWNEITLDQAVPIDGSETLWVGFYVESTGYPAGAGNYTGSPNSDLISLDGILWEHLSDYGLPYTWNMGIYCEASKWMRPELLPSDVADLDIKTIDYSREEKLKNKPQASLKMGDNKALMGYYIYRDGVLINEMMIPPDSCYYDTVPYPASVCYEVTAYYEFCGESDPSNEACVDFLWNTNELQDDTQIHPNPSQNQINFESMENIYRIKIFNQLGGLVLDSNPIHHKTHQIQLGHLANGIYFAEIKTKSGIQTSKIIIQK